MSNLIDELFPTPSLEERRANAQKRLTEIESGLASLSNQILEVFKRLPGGPYPPNQAWDFLHEQWKEISWLADVAELQPVPPPAAVPTLCDYERQLFLLREAALARVEACRSSERRAEPPDHPNGRISKNDPWEHDDEFAWMYWGGTRKRFEFTAKQRIVVKTLWGGGKRRPILEKSLLKACDSAADSLRSVFKTKGKMHDAWGSMIKSTEVKDLIEIVDPPDHED